IDVGIVFDVDNDDYDSNKLKKLVRDKLNSQHNRTVIFKRPCITVDYADGYHVDLAIYANNNNNLHIAWGKEFSSQNRCWYKSDPRGLTEWVKNVSTVVEERQQFRRCVRYLKKWKEKRFGTTSNSAPPSIGLTVQAGNSYQYACECDIEALINIVTQMKSAFWQDWDDKSESCKYRVKVELPVDPYKDIYYKMTLEQMDAFYQEVDDLLEALSEVYSEESEHEASKIMRKIFGEEFALIEESQKTATAPYVTTGQNA
ncbi:cyclic GMP-AMP synthase DncV-like nucleotidyltransferase, partial [Piscirickettsia salmonis]